MQYTLHHNITYHDIDTFEIWYWMARRVYHKHRTCIGILLVWGALKKSEFDFWSDKYHDVWGFGVFWISYHISTRLRSFLVGVGYKWTLHRVDYFQGRKGTWVKMKNWADLGRWALIAQQSSTDPLPHIFIILELHTRVSHFIERVCVNLQSTVWRWENTSMRKVGCRRKNGSRVNNVIWERNIVMIDKHTRWLIHVNKWS